MHAKFPSMQRFISSVVIGNMINHADYIKTHSQQTHSQCTKKAYAPIWCMSQEKFCLWDEPPNQPGSMIISSCSSQLSMKFILLINVKMPTIVDLHGSFKARKIFIFQQFSFNEHLKFNAELSWAWFFYNLWPALLQRLDKSCTFKFSELRYKSIRNANAALV